MSEKNHADKKQPSIKKEELNDPVQAGKKAIEADKKINKKNKSDDEKNKEEKKDAEQWRNEG